MYTNELLEEKYKAQKKLYENAKRENVDYFEFVEQEFKKIFEARGWTKNQNNQNTTLISEYKSA